MPVEFDTDEHHKSILYAKLLQQSDEAPSLINWLKKSGLAKSDEGANRILICVMIFSFCLTAWTVYRNYYRTDPDAVKHRQSLNEGLRLENLPPPRINQN